VAPALWASAFPVRSRWLCGVLAAWASGWNASIPVLHAVARTSAEVTRERRDMAPPIRDKS
jgi:hypothetical protein